MNTETRYCEDCGIEVTVYGGYEMGTDEFLETDRDGHQDHDLSDPNHYERSGI